MPSAAADREHEQTRRHPERETLELAAAGAARTLGVDHRATKALARAAITMDKADLWKARLVSVTCRRDDVTLTSDPIGATRVVLHQDYR